MSWEKIGTMLAFFKGSTGAIYRQFSITLVSAMVLSVFVAVILIPALCATMLKPSAGHNRKSAVWSWFNRAFERTTHRYGLSVGYIANRALRFSLIYLVLIGAIASLSIIKRLNITWKRKKSFSTLALVS